MTTLSAPDDYGNITLSTTQAIDAQSANLGYSSSIKNQYSNDPATWALGRLLKTTVNQKTPAAVPTATPGNAPNATATSGN